MMFAKPLGNEPLQGLPEGLCHGALEHLGRGRIEEDHALVAIDADNGVHRRFDNAQQPQPALLQRAFHLQPRGDAGLQRAGTLPLQPEKAHTFPEQSQEHDEKTAAGEYPGRQAGPRVENHRGLQDAQQNGRAEDPAEQNERGLALGVVRRF